MKSIKLFLIYFLLISAVPAFSQKGKTKLQADEFKAHWSMLVNAGASYTLGESNFKDLLSPSASLFAGYQFTPVWGLRFGISGWEAKGAWAPVDKIFKYNYLQGNLDAVLHLDNLFCNYNPDRFFNPYLFAGLGVNGAFNNDDAIELASQGNKLGYLWNDHKTFMVGRTGLGANLRLCTHLYLNLEANLNVLSDKYNSKKASHADWQFNLLGGLHIKFGKTSKKHTAPVEVPVNMPQVVPAAPAEECKAEPESVVEVQKTEPLQVDVFFTINSAVIRDCEESKITRIVEFLKANSKAAVVVCGYADKGTGTASVNDRVSKRRADAVFKALVQAGIPESRITVEHKGDTVQPFKVNNQNRVCICVAK